jgi:hypothetical protein
MNLILMIFFSTVLIVLSPQMVNGVVDPSSYFYPADSKPFGKSYQEWAAIWWKFVLENQTKDDTRLMDKDGHLCHVNQTGSVWILPGANSFDFERSCKIPEGVSLLISPTDGYCSEKTMKGASIEQIRQCAIDDVAGDHTDAFLDGVKLVDTNATDFVSVPFDLYYPPGEGPYKALAGGLYMMLKPLSPGNHTLYQEAGQKPLWGYSVKYNIQVIPN